MPCESFQDALIEAVASGAEPQGELRVHLQNCAACQAAFEQEQALFAGMDAGLRAVANAEVPPSLLPRVRAALDEMPAPGAAWSAKWFVLAGASAMLVVIFVAQTLWHTPIQKKPLETAANATQPSTAAGLPKIENPGALAAANPGSDVARVHAGAERVHLQHNVSGGEAQPEVLVPRDQGILLARYAEEWAHRKGAPVLRADANESTLAPLEVAPIQIAELDVKLLAESNSQ